MRTHKQQLLIDWFQQSYMRTILSDERVVWSGILINLAADSTRPSIRHPTLFLLGFGAGSTKQ